MESKDAVNVILQGLIKSLKAEEQKALEKPSQSENVGNDSKENFYYRVGLNFSIIQIEDAINILNQSNGK